MNNKDYFISNSKEETQAFAENFSKDLQTGDFLAFYGDLGSGKTTFIQGLARGLGIKKRIISPTFIILRHYNLTQGNFYHVDLYRTESKHDLLGIGLDQIIQDPNSIVALEWAEKMGDLMPQKRIEIRLKYLNNQQREISIKRYENQIDKAVKVLNQGGIIVFPTDTAFGIGCRVDNEKAVRELFEIRRRPLSQATPILINSLEMAKEYVTEIAEDVIEKLINPFWPGALTIVLKADQNKVPPLVQGGGETVGVRMPNRLVALDIITKVGVPILGPSANFHGESTPYEFKDLNPKLISLVDYVIDGKCSVKKASTVIDCTKSPWQILRQGVVTVKI